MESERYKYMVDQTQRMLSEAMLGGHPIPVNELAEKIVNYLVHGAGCGGIYHARPLSVSHLVGDPVLMRTVITAMLMDHKDEGFTVTGNLLTSLEPCRVEMGLQSFADVSTISVRRP